jgi:hypothetical protein
VQTLVKADNLDNRQPVFLCGDYKLNNFKESKGERMVFFLEK